MDIDKDTEANTAVAEVVDKTDATTTPVAEASKVGMLDLATATAGTSQVSEERKTELCCGSCCDYIRACVVVDIIWIILAAANMYGPAVGLIYYEEPDPNEIVEDEDAVVFTRRYLWVLLIWSAVSLAIGALSILAATTFNKLVLIGAVDLIIEAVAAAVVYRDWFGIPIRLLIAYPHIGLFLALKKGTISRETYEREKYCCCC